MLTKVILLLYIVYVFSVFYYCDQQCKRSDVSNRIYDLRRKNETSRINWPISTLILMFYNVIMLFSIVMSIVNVSFNMTQYKY